VVIHHVDDDDDDDELAVTFLGDAKYLRVKDSR